MTKRVLHVTEAYAGGVQTAIQDYVRNTSDEYHHYLAYAFRENASLDSLQTFTESYHLPDGHFARIGYIRHLAKANAYDVIHAHSSFAGVYARLAVPQARKHIVYTPHAYSFIRRDIPLWEKSVFYLFEFSLSHRTCIYACCSPHEATLTRRFPLTSHRVYVVPNAARGQESVSLFSGADPHMCMIGRLSNQKDPVFFRDCWEKILETFPKATATWYGDGDVEYRHILESSGVKVTGWLSFEQIRNDIMTKPSVYLHSALWEGFPISLLEMAQLGIPIVVRRIPAFEDCDIPVLVNKPEEITNAISSFTNPIFIRDVAHRILLGHSDSDQRAALEQVYSSVGGNPNS